MAKCKVAGSVIYLLVLLGSSASPAWGSQGWTCVNGSDSCTIGYDWDPGMGNSFQVKFRARDSVRPQTYTFMVDYVPIGGDMNHRQAFRWNVFISPGITGPLSPPISGSMIVAITM